MSEQYLIFTWLRRQEGAIWLSRLLDATSSAARWRVGSSRCNSPAELRLIVPHQLLLCAELLPWESLRGVTRPKRIFKLNHVLFLCMCMSWLCWTALLSVFRSYFTNAIPFHDSAGLTLTGRPSLPIQSQVHVKYEHVHMKSIFNIKSIPLYIYDIVIIQ